ncbi:sigma-B regulation protein RsbU (phosphoserine phosphatase) [Alkalibacillus filiformis]|uniref:Sigma-B regulation protein RsbU (Phosphoserine phosphatase) n=1 Tax=Alkalibacillus filiformis TaxID=200990 RepID=A0ABU0DWY6_9BACI|nr:PP2C family protein-serine/threonine phosphatase [Alkalibacillus filiformis]MDQ0352979.1 sigma-B regulation protein RsbU (phosphoserine phosphatase) [Alkalibacillus filiformis]
MSSLQTDMQDYKDLLSKYLETKDEAILYQAEQFSKQSIQQNISPDEIVNVHYQALKDIYPDLHEQIEGSFKFLIETMISYGLAYQEHQVLREKQIELKSEIGVAANMQNTLLKTSVPKTNAIDIGVKSVPAKEMNGDYHHFIKDEQGNVGVAIADVIGKGIPAAFCMSMIKFAMESFSENQIYPQWILDSLNRVVNKNVEQGMFVTMFYGLYDVYTHQFYYASAGHEPCFILRNETKEFEEIDAKGLLLGVESAVKYEQLNTSVFEGDLIVLLTDGVTECRVDGRFIEQEEVLNIIKEHEHLNSQEIVDHVFKYFERLQDFQLRDDFTLVVMKRNTSLSV